MKKITAFLLALVMTLGLCVTAYADDGSQSTTVTVNVATGSYTVNIPEDITLDIYDVVEATEAPGEKTAESANYIGSAYVSNVSHCRYVKCRTEVPLLKCGDSMIRCSVLSKAPEAKKEEAKWDYRTCQSEMAFTQYPYYAGRTMRKAVALNGNDTYEMIDMGTTTMEDASLQLWLNITSDQADGIESGLYTGSLNFVFSSSNKAPTEVDLEFVDLIEEAGDALKITKQPSNYQVSYDALYAYYDGPYDYNHTFTVTAEGRDITYQWEYSEDSVTWKTCLDANGGKTDAFIVTIYRSSSNTVLDYGQYKYRCKITDKYGNTITSDIVWIETVGKPQNFL